MLGLQPFFDQANLRPNALALAAGDARWSYAELRERAGRIAACLMANSGADEAFLGLAVSDGPDFYAGLLAAWMLGRAYVPFRLNDPPERNRAIFDALGLKTALLPEEASPDLLAEYPALNWIQAGEAEGFVPWEKAAPHDPDRIAYVLFTSGSTGTPKGVPIRWRNLDAFSAALLESGLYDFGPNDRFLQIFQPTFDLSVFSFWIPWQTGGSVFVVPQAGTLAFNASWLLEEEGLTVALMTPSTLGYLRPYFDDLRLPRLRLSLFCGEALSHRITAEWAACVPNARIENVYGPTEATIFCSRYVWEDERSQRESWQGIVPIGEALPGMELRLDGDDEESELLLIGPQVSGEYWLDPERTSRQFFQDESGAKGYRSGDLCRVSENGQFLFAGRVDFQVKIDGYRIELGEIEHQARSVSGCENVAAIPVQTGDAWKLLLFLQGWKGPTDEVSAGLREKLPHYMVPQAVFALDALPLNSSGKIDRKALAELASQPTAGSAAFT